MAVLMTLAASNDHKIRHIAVSTIANLCEESICCGRIVSEGGLQIISSISTSSTNPATTRACARAIHTLAATADNGAKMVEGGVVELLSVLSRSGDALTREFCTLAMCGLLNIKQAASDILQCGAVSALIQLSEKPNEGTRHSTAKALYALAHSDVSLQVIASDAVIPAILRLCRSRMLSTKIYAVASLYHLARMDPARKQIQEDGAVSCLAELLKEKSGSTCLTRFVLGAISMLVDAEESSAALVEQDAIPALLTECSSHDLQIKTLCCSILTSLTFHLKSRRALSHQDILPALIELTSLRDKDVQQRCAISLGNLSAEQALQGKMVEYGVVTVLAKLSNSYSEENQKYCAKALFNLSCISGYETALVEQGAVDVLLMISVVRAVCISTKEACAYALVNLLVPDTIGKVIESGLVPTLSNLSSCESENIAHACGVAYYILASKQDGRQALCSTAGSMQAMFPLIPRSASFRERIICLAGVLCQLVCDPNTIDRALDHGIIDGLRLLISQSEHVEIFSMISHAFLSISADIPTKLLLAKAGVVNILVNILHSEETLRRIGADTNKICEIKKCVSQTLENLASTADCATFMSAELLVPTMIATINESSETDILLSCASILCFLSQEENKRKILVQTNFLQALETLGASKDADVAMACSLLLRDLTGIGHVFEEQEIKVLVDLWCNLSVSTNDPFTLLNLAETLCNIAFSSTQVPLLVEKVRGK